jgi:hypothetical protein
MPDIVLTPDDQLAFRAALIHAYHNAERLEQILDDIQFPRERWPVVPAGTANTDRAWRDVFTDLREGILPDGFRTLLTTVLHNYPHNQTFRDLATRHASQLVNGDEPTPRTDSCYVFIRANSDQERQVAEEYLEGQGLAPGAVMSTNLVTLFRLGTSDEARVRRAMSGSDLAWTVVTPGQPYYLLSHLIVQGPDGRSFRFTDVPASTTVAGLAADALAEYPSQDTTRATVTDRVQANGQGERLSPDATLDQAGVTDGDRLRVGFEARAGAINPIYQNDALARAARQIRAFAEMHPGIALTANAPELATCYELEFRQRSFGPPPPPQGPVEIEEHVVQIEFGPDFPQVAPTVFWMTEIFHPNIWPNYDSQQARERPQFQGLVCLGELSDAYEPAMDLGHLCQTLIDIAAYRNYSLFVATGGVTMADGSPQAAFQGNAFDVTAAVWAMQNQNRIAKMGGRPAEGSRPPSQRTYRHAVEPYTP